LDSVFSSDTVPGQALAMRSSSGVANPTSTGTNYTETVASFSSGLSSTPTSAAAASSSVPGQTSPQVQDLSPSNPGIALRVNSSSVYTEKGANYTETEAIFSGNLSLPTESSGVQILNSDSWTVSAFGLSFSPTPSDFQNSSNASASALAATNHTETMADFFRSSQPEQLTASSGVQIGSTLQPDLLSSSGGANPTSPAASSSSATVTDKNSAINSVEPSSSTVQASASAPATAQDPATVTATATAPAATPAPPPPETQVAPQGVPAPASTPQASAQAAPESTPINSGAGGGRSSDGAIAGGIVGGVVGLAGLAVAADRFTNRGVNSVDGVAAEAEPVDIEMGGEQATEVLPIRPVASPGYAGQLTFVDQQK